MLHKVNKEKYLSIVKLGNGAFLRVRIVSKEVENAQYSLLKA